MLQNPHNVAASVIALCLWGGAPSALADPTWLTVVGDPLDPVSETVQVDVTSAVAFGTSRMVNIRTNRAKDRIARDGENFRSYDSLVLIDCANGTARHRSQVLYTEPLWRGATRSVNYDDKNVEVMAFRDMPANPKDRIIRAACNIALVKSR